MLRILAFFLLWLFFIAIQYGSVFPAIGRMIGQFQAILNPAGPLSSGLLGTLLDVLVLWIPLIATAGVIILIFVVATGSRGTSVRP